MRRATNQDSVAISLAGTNGAAQPGDLLMVADGMGAHAAGELASKLAADTIPHSYRKQADLAPQAALRQAVRRANDLIHTKGQSGPEFQGMGTTCSCLVLLGEAALVAHVGDSRVYRLRDDRLEQLTFDHSLVWELAAASHTAAEDVPNCIPKNVITRSLGPHEQVNVDLEGPYDLADGDVFLICSDGLTGVVDDTLIGAVLGAMPPEEAGQTLVDLANLRGGPDNISVAITRVSATPAIGDESSSSLSGVFQSSARSVGRVHPGVWLALLGCVLATVWFASQQKGLAAMAAAAGVGAMIVVALMQKGKSPLLVSPTELGGPYGDGPYRIIDCQPGEPAANAIAEVVEQLAELEGRDPAEPGPPIHDWSDFNEHRRLARLALEEGDAAEAVRASGAAIQTLMDQVREGRTVEFRP